MNESAAPLAGTGVMPPASASVGVSTGVAMAPAGQGASTAVASKVEKVIVAVHGVGDQYQYATIQSVVNQFCRFFSAPPATPLGSFHNGQTAYEFAPPLPAAELQYLAFAEVYWAKIPRDVVTDQHTLENAQNWARTIVERMRLRWHLRKQAGETMQDVDFPRLKRVLTEMIETLTVLERLCFLAERGGLFKFDIRKLVDDYLGDVQVVADFASSRRQILDAFATAMAGANAQYPKADLYIVAHSEGTVVTLLGLLEALRASPAPDWTHRIRGVMTIGSPIDKHLNLWPELFNGGPAVARPASDPPIEWVNYYDRGDPIGFELDDFRDFIKARGLQSIFSFSQDIGFSRYAFPGKAHVDYWEDSAVFRHFIATVVKPYEHRADDGSRHAAAVDVPKPGDRHWNRFVCYAFPYLLIGLLLLAAAYLPVKTISGYAGWQTDLRTTAEHVAGIACALLAITLPLRIPRLTRAPRWKAATLVLYAASVAAAALLLDVGTETWGPFAARVVRLFVITAVVIVASRVLTRMNPNFGAKPMLTLGTIALLGSAAILIEGGWQAPRDADHQLWPVVLATAGFVYLWWLATLVFDLTFVWHVYIRHSQAMKQLRRHRGTAAFGSSTAPVATDPIRGPETGIARM